MCAEMTRERAEEFGAARNSSAVRMFVFEHKPRGLDCTCLTNGRNGLDPVSLRPLGNLTPQ
jgi:hypothetical protein